MNHRAVIKTPEERCADALAYYYKNREKILEQKRLDRIRKKENKAYKA